MQPNLDLQLQDLESNVFHQSCEEKALAAVMVLGQTYEAVRATGVRGHRALNDSHVRSMGLMFFHQKRILSHTVLLALLDIIPVDLSLLEDWVQEPSLAPLLTRLVDQIISQQAFYNQDVRLDELMEIVGAARRFDVIIQIFEGLLSQEAQYSETPAVIFAKTLTMACELGWKPVIEWGIEHDKALSDREWSYELRSRSTMSDGIMVFRSGMELFGRSIMSQTHQSAQDDELTIREKLCAISLKGSDIREGLLKPKALVHYLYRCKTPETDIRICDDARLQAYYTPAISSLHLLKPMVKSCDVDYALTGTRIDASRFYAVTEALLTRCVTDFESFTRIMDAHVTVRDDVPSDFMEKVFPKQFEYATHSFYTLLSVIESAQRHHVDLLGEPYTKTIVERYLSSCGYGFGTVIQLRIMNIDGLMNILPREIFIEMTEELYSKAGDEMKDRFDKLAPQWLFNAVPAMKRRALSEGLDI